LRTKSIGTKVSEEEFAALEARARAVGLTLSEWVREALLAAPVEPAAGSGVDSGEVALGEILALRSLLQSKRQHVACFVKQVGRQPWENGNRLKLLSSKGGESSEWPMDIRVREYPSISS
jgi:hypothetical protein